MHATLARIVHWYARAIGAHSVDGILADFSKKLDQLHAAAKFYDAEAKAHDEAIRLSIEARNFAEKQTVRAYAVADKIKALIAA